MKQALTKLTNVKSIVTLTLTAVFAVLAVRGAVTSEQYMTIFTTVIAFYFGTQSEKKARERGKDGE